MEKEKYKEIENELSNLEKRTEKEILKNMNEIKINIYELKFKDNDIEFWKEYEKFYNENGVYEKYINLKNEIELIKSKDEEDEDLYNIKNNLNETVVGSCGNIIQKYSNLLWEELPKKTVKKIQKIDQKYQNLLKEQKEYDKKILEMMGIFLTIFSVIGLGVSNVLKENVNSSSIFMICGVILITMTGLYSLINNKFEKIKFSIIDIGIILLIAGGTIRCIFSDDNKELIKKDKFEQVEKEIQNIENEIPDKNLDYRNQIKDLKEEIKKLQSKVEKLEKKRELKIYFEE